MVEEKYFEATSNLALVKQAEGQNKIEEETDRFFNCILRNLRTALKERNYSNIVCTVRKVPSDRNYAYLVNGRERFETELDEKSFYHVVLKTKKILGSCRKICGYTMKIATGTRGSSAVMMITLSK